MTTTQTDAAPIPTSVLIVDGTNIEIRCRECFGTEEIDFAKFFAKVTNGTKLLEIYYFTAAYSRSADPKRLAMQSGRLNVLKSLGVKVVLGRHVARKITCRECKSSYTGYTEKGTDVAAAIKLVECAIGKHADQLFLLAGDNDYVPALKFCRGKVPVTVGFVIGRNESVPSQLAALADLRHNSVAHVQLDTEFMTDCWRPARPQK